MRVLRALIMALAVLSVCSAASAQEFAEDFESYAAGTDLHGESGWKGWDGAAGAGAPVSDAFAYGGSNSVEIVPSADLVHEFDVAGGKWVFTAMQYIPSGGSGETYFILLNSYDDGANQDWSIQTRYNLANGNITTWTGGADASVVFDQWVELKYIINLDENTVDEYYDGTLIDTRVWDDNNHGTIGAIDLYGNGASSVYYDDISLVSFFAPPRDPSPANGDDDAARDGVLSWAPGQYAASHNVYFSTSMDDVQAGDPSALVSAGQAGTSFDPGLLEFGQTYYWRVEAVSAAPDNTIYTSSVWSFQAEPFVYPIENIIASSNSTPDAGAVPENTVNGSGLNENDEHSRVDADMWLGAPEGADPVYIQFEFDRVYKLFEMAVWNYNGEFETILAFGIKDVTIEYGEDGENWTVLGDYTLAQGTASADYTANTTIDLEGVPAKFLRMTANSGYGMFGKYGLSEVRILQKPVQARKPQPADAAVDVVPSDVLSWRTGREAVSHEVYLSADEAAVADGTALVATITESSYALSNLDVEYGTTYYWKVNEVNEAEAISTWEGDVWSFAAAEFAVVDDFESYDDEDNRIYDTWIDGYNIDGNGSQVGNIEAPFAEQTIVNNGSQSMPLFYDNSAAPVSEAELSLGQDWTGNGIKTLSLFFYGAADNGGQLYVKINGTKVAYDGDAGDVAEAIWQPWNIDLSAVGGNLSNVNSLIIGIEGAGASGVVFIDDVRLYPKAPELIVPVQPDAANLVAHYAFDGDFSDATGGHNGAAMGDARIASDPAQGQVLSLDGAGDAVEVPYSADLNPEAFSASIWANPDPAGSGHRSPITSRDDGPQRGYIIYLEPGNTWQFWTGTGAAWNNTGGPAAALGEWTHLAITYADEAKAFYVNGRLVGQGTAPIGLNTAQVLRIGAGATESPDGNYFFQGMLDEARIYNRALSAEEVAGLAGKTNPMHKPL